VGRRNGNCISCSKGADDFEILKYKNGKDGRLYMTSGAAKAGKGVDLSQTNAI